MTQEYGQEELTDTDLEHARTALAEYARTFFPSHSEDRSNISLKLDHCLRVFRHAMDIVSGEGIEAETARPAVWAALFHDIGRFPQYARFGTFDDRKSVDHGRLGVRTLKQLHFLAPLKPAHQKSVLAAITLHNRRVLPPGLPDEYATVAKVVRDADKLDIFGVLLEQLRPSAKPNHVVTLGLRDDPSAYTGIIVNQVLQGRLADYGNMFWINDFRLLLCSWIYDLNFPSTCKTLLDRDILEELLSPLPDTPDIMRVKSKIRMDMKTLLKE